MKRPAFYLVVGVVGMQILIVIISLAMCFVFKRGAATCDPGGELGQLMSGIITQCFALYAAEK